MRKLNRYKKIVGNKIIESIKANSEPLRGKYILNINSTYQGGGVAEILNSLVLLMNDTGINTGWRILHGNPDFFTVTKKFHNALQGNRIYLSNRKKKIYFECNEKFSIYTHIDHDCVIIHDLQPLPLIKFYKKRQPWIWRCHIDISHPNKHVWNYVKGFISQYDAMVISSQIYKKRDLQVPQHVIMPSIDPLDSKNKELPNHTISKYLSKFGIETDKPIISQISRFDHWKDPEGVIKVYKEVKKKVDCRLVLLGSFAIDDPEGQEIYEHLVKEVANDDDIVLIAFENDILVNALQRASAVVLQKSIKEGFGLTASEALWKKTPVVASNVGGLPLQVINGKSGYLVNPYDYKGHAKKVIKLLNNPKMAEKMGEFGKEYVRKNLLITKYLLKWIKLIRRHILYKSTL